MRPVTCRKTPVARSKKDQGRGTWHGMDCQAKIFFSFSFSFFLFGILLLRSILLQSLPFLPLSIYLAHLYICDQHQVWADWRRHCHRKAKAGFLLPRPRVLISYYPPAVGSLRVFSGQNFIIKPWPIVQCPAWVLGPLRRMTLRVAGPYLRTVGLYIHPIGLVTVPVKYRVFNGAWFSPPSAVQAW